MDINGVIRVNMTGAEIEEALLKARDLPTNAQLTTILNEMQADIDARLGRIEEKTYDEMVALRDAGELVPGQLYRITDYVTTTMLTSTRSAGHPFDIVVLALTTDTLSEEAMAMNHEGDDYFSESDLAAWRLKYTLDNIEHSAVAGEYFVFNDLVFQKYGTPFELDGVMRQSWFCNEYVGATGSLPGLVVTGVNPSVGDDFYDISAEQHIMTPSAGVIGEMGGGKGTITYMKDEYNNECLFDFKNIQVKRWKVADELHRDYLEGKYLGTRDTIAENLSIPDTSDYIWTYLFGQFESGNETTDLSITSNVSGIAFLQKAEKNNAFVITSGLHVGDRIVDSVFTGDVSKCSFGGAVVRCTFTGSVTALCTGAYMRESSVSGLLQNSSLGAMVEYCAFSGWADKISFCSTAYNCIISGQVQSAKFRNSLTSVTISGDVSEADFMPNIEYSVIEGTLHSIDFVVGSSYGDTASNVHTFGTIERYVIALQLNIPKNLVFVAPNENGVVKIWNPADLVQ